MLPQLPGKRPASVCRLASPSFQGKFVLYDDLKHVTPTASFCSAQVTALGSPSSCDCFVTPLSSSLAISMPLPFCSDSLVCYCFIFLAVLFQPCESSKEDKLQEHSSVILETLSLAPKGLLTLLGCLPHPCIVFPFQRCSGVSTAPTTPCQGGHSGRMPRCTDPCFRWLHP